MATERAVSKLSSLIDAPLNLGSRLLIQSEIGQTGGVGSGKVRLRARRLAELLVDEVEQYPAAATVLPELEANPAAVDGKRYAFFGALAAHVRLRALLPQPAPPVRADQAEGRVGSRDGHAASAGHQVQHGIVRPGDFPPRALAGAVPNEHGRALVDAALHARERAARIEPLAVGRPGDCTEIALEYVLGVGQQDPRQRGCVVDLHRGAVGKAHRHAIARGVRGNRVGPLAAPRRNGLGRARVAGRIAPQGAVVGYDVERARAVEGRAIRIGGVAPVLGHQAPACQVGARSLPHAQTAALEHGRRQIAPVRRYGEVGDAGAERAEPRLDHGR